MKNQYTGDIGDYGKYGLLRFLARQGIRIGINWYLTDDDNSANGKYTSYLENPAERVCDPELFDALKEIVSHGKNKSVKMVQDAGLISGAEYFGEKLKGSKLEVSAREWDRRLWFNNSTLILGDSELIFADPDNGISFTKTARNKDSEKFVLPEEICRYYYEGRNVVYYCHKGRRKQEDWEKAKTQIRQYIRDAQILAVTFCRGTQRSYIFVIHPDCYQKYEQMLKEFLQTEWCRMFRWETVKGNVSTAGMNMLIDSTRISIEVLSVLFSVCKVPDYSGVDIGQPFVFIGSTDEEKSLVCPYEFVPANTTHRDDGWVGFRICGELEFSLIGVLAGISKVLAENEVGIFVISTYNTDYILVKKENFEKASRALREAGYIFRTTPMDNSGNKGEENERKVSKMRRRNDRRNL